MEPAPRARGATLAWAAYDWANSAFATTVVAGFFPAFFKDYWSGELAATESTFWLGAALTVAGATVAATAPVLGGIADRAASKKRLLGAFAALGASATAGLALVGQGRWPVALALYVVAYVGWLSSLIFYDALLPAVSDARNVDRVSSLGFALGYLGGGLLFALQVAWFLAPATFGFGEGGEGKIAAVKASFASVALWWAVFSIPLFARVPEPGAERAIPLGEAARSGLRETLETFREARRTPGVLPFLVAYWLYIDGVDTVIVMAVDFGKAIGIGTGELIAALLMVQFVAFPCAYAFGRAGERVGPKRMILFGLAVYVLITILGSALRKEPWEVLGLRVPGFFVLAGLVGMVQGGVQALSRSLFTRLLPEGREGALFGFYNMVGKLAAILGPALVGVTARVTGEPRAGLLSLIVLFVAGGGLLARVRVAGRGEGRGARR